MPKQRQQNLLSSRRPPKWFSGLMLFVAALLAGQLFVGLQTPQVLAANITWDGGGDGVNWSDDLNWVGDVEPGTGDVAVFDGTDTSNVTINTSIDVQGIDINSGYTGTITQGAGNTVTVGSGGVDISDGTFTGGNSTIDVNGAFTVSGGAFTSTSDELQVSGNFTVSSGSFDPSTGTVVSQGSGASWDVQTTETFNNFRIENGSAANTNIDSGDTLIVNGTLTLTEGRVQDGTIDARGDIVQQSGFDGGSATIEFGDDGVVQTYTVNGGIGPVLELDDADDASDVIDFDAAGEIGQLRITSGFSGSIPITNPSDVVVTIGNWNQDAGTYDASAQTEWEFGTFTRSGGTFTAPETTTAIRPGVTWDVPTSQTFENFTIDIPFNGVLTITSGDTLIVTDALTLSDGRVSVGTIDARGDITQTAFDGGSATIEFGDDGVAQTYTISGGTSPGIELDSAADANDVIDFDAAGEINRLDITSGFSGSIPITNPSDFVITVNDWNQDAGTYDASAQTEWEFLDFDRSAGSFTAPETTTAIGSSTTWDVPTSQTFENLTIDKPFNALLTISSGDTLIVTDLLTLTDGRVGTGTIDARSNITQGSSFDGGGATIEFGDDGVAQTYTISGGTAPRIELDSAADANDVIDFDGAAEVTGVTITAGFSGAIPITNPSDFVITVDDWDQSAGTYDASAQTEWEFDDFNISGGSFTAPGLVTTVGSTATWAITGTQVVNDLTIDRDFGGTMSISSGVLQTDGTLILADGRLGSNSGGYVEPQGNVTVQSAWDGGGGGILRFGGSNVQTFDLTGATSALRETVFVNKSGGRVDLASDLSLTFDGQDVTIEEGIFHLNGFNLTVSGSPGEVVVEDGGVFSWESTETLTLNGTDPQFNAGSAVRFTGDGDAGADTYDVMSYFTNDIEGLIVDSQDGATDTFEINETVDWSGPFDLVSGTFETNGNQMSVAGNWSNTGTFQHESNTVFLDGTSQTISGSTTFNNLSKTVSSADTLTFEAGETQTIVGAMTLQGVDGDLLSLRSTVADSATSIDPQGTRNVEYLDVKDNTNANVTTIDCTTGCEDSGGNTNWNISGGAGGGGGGSYSDAEAVFSRLRDPTVSDVDISYTSGAALSDGTTITIDFPAGFTSPTAPTGGSGLGTGPTFGTSGNDFTVTCGTGGCQAGAITITGGTITTPPTPGTYIIQITNDENSDTASVAVPILDDDQVTVTAQVDATLVFDIDTSTADADTDAPYTVELGAITSTDTRVSGSTDAINFIWLDIESNSANGIVVTTQNANGANGLVSTSVGTDAIETNGGTLADGSEEYGMCVVSTSQTTGTLQTTGSYASPTTCAANDETNDVEVLSTSPASIFDTNDAPMTGGRAQIAVGASVSSITPAHPDYTDTITFIGTARY